MPSGNDFVKLGSVVFQGMLLDILYANLYDTLAERHLNDVTDLDGIGSLCILAVHLDVLGVASVVGDGSSFDNAGNLQKFV